MSSVGPKVPRDRSSTNEFMGIDRLDRAELDEDEDEDWATSTSVRRMKKCPSVPPIAPPSTNDENKTELRSA
jgi:hypothetical protein